MSKLIVITGQTATGKTKLAIDLALKYNGEVINADSRQIYKFLDIVSGKDKELFHVPIHLYDIVDPKDSFSSNDWSKLALHYINIMKSKGKTPIIVGGTYLYLYHLLYGIETEGVKPNWELRKKLSDKSVQDLQNILKDIDTQLFESLNASDKKNPQRLIRKIEIASVISNQQSAISNNLQFKFKLKDFDIEFIGLRYKNRTDLRNALRKRVEDRVKKGAIEEVKDLLVKGYKLNDPGLSTNACMEIYQYLTGEFSKEELVEKWITLEMQYAKRQYTFMKRDPNIKWKEL